MDTEHKNPTLEKIDMQVVSVEACDISEAKKSFASLADREDLQLDPDLMYARFIMCHEGSNANGDTFTNDVLARAQHTPRLKPINWEHGQPMIGVIVDSRYAEDAQGRGYIEAIGVIWKFIYPEMAEKIKIQSATGGLKLSMECYFKDANYKYGEQIFDQEQADELGISDYVGREYMGSKVYRVFKNVVFGAVGVVENPADKEAVFLAVAKKHADEVVANQVIENVTDEQIQAIANIIRNTNDFTRKQLSRDTVDAVTVAKYVKVFDKAKSDIVSKFNKDNIATKEQLVSEVRSIIELLLSDVSNINNDFYVGVASEEDNSELDTTDPIEVENQEEGIDEMDNEQIQVVENESTAEDTVVEQVVAEEASEEAVVVSEENVEVAGEVTVEEVDTTDYKAKATELEEINSKLSEKLNEIEKSYNELKNKVEASEKEKLVDSRMAELTELGIEFSEARKAKEVEKISAMDSDSFADYKDFLSEIAGRNSAEATEAPTEEAEVETEEVEEVEVEVEVETAQAGLNIETEQPKVIKPFSHLAE